MGKSKSPNQYFAAPAPHAPKTGRVRSHNLPGIRAGIICEQHGVAWAVSPHRAVMRAGAQQRVPWGSYAEELLQCVTIGTKDWEAARVADPVIIPEQLEESASPVKSYCLSFTVVEKGKIKRAQYHHFFAENDDEAWLVADGHMSDVGVNPTNQRQAVLFQEEHEVRRPTHYEL